MSRTTTPDPDATDRSGRRKLLIGLAVVAVAVLAAAAWYLTRPEAATVDISNALGGATETTSPSPAPNESAEREASAPTSPTPATSSSQPSEPAGGGRAWTVTTDLVPYDFDAAAGTFVGFRIDEELSRIGSTTAVGRTPAVSGELLLDDTTVTSATFTADLTEMTSDRAQRNGAIQRALDTSTNPEATFELTEPVELGAIPPVGEAVDVEGVGELTVNGTTVSTTMPLQAGLRAEDELVVTGSTDLALSDFDIAAPSAPIVVSVSDTATLEVQLFLTP